MLLQAGPFGQMFLPLLEVVEKISFASFPKPVSMAKILKGSSFSGRADCLTSELHSLSRLALRSHIQESIRNEINRIDRSLNDDVYYIKRSYSSSDIDQFLEKIKVFSYLNNKKVKVIDNTDVARLQEAKKIYLDFFRVRPRRGVNEAPYYRAAWNDVQIASHAAGVDFSQDATCQDLENIILHVVVLSYLFGKFTDAIRSVMQLDAIIFGKRSPFARLPQHQMCRLKYALLCWGTLSAIRGGNDRIENWIAGEVELFIKTNVNIDSINLRKLLLILKKSVTAKSMFQLLKDIQEVPGGGVESRSGSEISILASLVQDHAFYVENVNTRFEEFGSKTLTEWYVSKKEELNDLGLLERDRIKTESIDLLIAGLSGNLDEARSIETNRLNRLKNLNWYTNLEVAELCVNMSSTMGAAAIKYGSFEAMEISKQKRIEARNILIEGRVNTVSINRIIGD